MQGARTLVIGNGRIGRLLSGKLSCLGADVTVSARSARDFAWIENSCHHVLDTRRLSGHLSGFDLVINTVPAKVLGAAELAELPAGCLIIDLASKPGGVVEAIALQICAKIGFYASVLRKVKKMQTC